jgi:hypothetical protein
MTTSQPNVRSFRAGDRIIYNGQFIGTLLSPSGDVKGLHWKVQWEDGAETDNVYPQADMVFANGGPDSGQRGVQNIVAAALAERPEYCPYDCDSCHDEDCPCDRMGCAGEKKEDS